MHHISLMICGAVFAVSSPAYSQSNFAEIEATIQKYLDGTQYGKQELVTEAFSTSLEVQRLGEQDVLMRRPGTEYISRIEADKTVPRYGRLISLDATDRSAMAKVEIDWNDRLYTDYMLLLRIEGQWKITNKIATWVERESSE